MRASQISKTVVHKLHTTTSSAVDATAAATVSLVASFTGNDEYHFVDVRTYSTLMLTLAVPTPPGVEAERAFFYCRCAHRRSPRPSSTSSTLPLCQPSMPPLPSSLQMPSPPPFPVPSVSTLSHTCAARTRLSNGRSWQCRAACAGLPTASACCGTFSYSRTSAPSLNSTCSEAPRPPSRASARCSVRATPIQGRPRTRSQKHVERVTAVVCPTALTRNARPVPCYVRPHRPPLAGADG
jgi:hypothetical protein